MTFATLALLVASGTVQHIACHPADDVHSPERVILSFVFEGRDPQPLSGTFVLTFVLTSGLDHDGEQDSTGKLPLVDATDSQTPAGTAAFETRDEFGKYVVLLAESDLGRATKHLEVSVEYERLRDRARGSQDYHCYASTFDRE